jgi:hypothetical protein
VALGKAPDADALLHVADVLVADTGGTVYWSPDGVQWASGSPWGDWWIIGGDGDAALALSVLGRIWLTTDGRTWLDTKSQFVHAQEGNVHQFMRPIAFCIGAGRIVTILQDDAEIGAFYADLNPTAE